MHAGNWGYIGFCYAKYIMIQSQSHMQENPLAKADRSENYARCSWSASSDIQPEKILIGV